MSSGAEQQEYEVQNGPGAIPGGNPHRHPTMDMQPGLGASLFPVLPALLPLDS